MPESNCQLRTTRQRVIGICRRNCTSLEVICRRRIATVNDHVIITVLNRAFCIHQERKRGVLAERRREISRDREFHIVENNLVGENFTASLCRLLGGVLALRLVSRANPFGLRTWTRELSYGPSSRLWTNLKKILCVASPSRRRHRRRCPSRSRMRSRPYADFFNRLEFLLICDHILRNEAWPIIVHGLQFPSSQFRHVFVGLRVENHFRRCLL